MDYSFLFWSMIGFTIFMVAGAIFVAKWLDKKSKGK